MYFCQLTDNKLDNNMKVVIVGGGVVGLTTALQLKKNYYFANSDINIVSESYDDLVSYVAAGIFRIGDDYSGPTKNITRKWINDSYEFYEQIQKSHESSVAGISKISCYMYSNIAPIKHHWMKQVIPVCRDITPNEFNLVNGSWKYGSYLETMITQCSSYLPWARNKLNECGTKLLTKKLQSLDELYDDYDLIINCTGLGAKRLCNDSHMIPIRGQVAKVKAPWLKVCFYSELDTYIIPGTDGYCTLGGTRDFNSMTTDICQHTHRSIRERCEHLLPSLTKAPTVKQLVGLRPYREGGVRVEIEKTPSGHRAKGIVHNYGHGGYGVCTAPGTSIFAIKLAEDVFKSSSSSSKL